MDWILQPWPWYVAGPLIGLTVPLLLIVGNKSFGVSSSLKHICAACFPAGIDFFKYEWRNESWNLWFVAGIAVGGFIASDFLSVTSVVDISQSTIQDLKALGISNMDAYVPTEIFSWSALGSINGILFIVVGGFLVGFGTRYAGGCTSGHAIFGMSNFQKASMIAVIGFFIGGLVMTHLLFPLIF